MNVATTTSQSSQAAEGASGASAGSDRARTQLIHQISEVYHRPLLELVYAAATVHRQHHNPTEIQLSQLLSIKTGGCKEDCAYCPQSAHYDTPVQAERMWDVGEIVAQAQAAQARGAQRFCMGAAWSSPPTKGPVYASLLASARQVSQLGLEVCMTLGMLDETTCRDLKQAGVDYYNHNIDTSPEYYQKIITTRTYEDRLRTLANVRAAGMKVCCGGIIGMGEAAADRIAMLAELCLLPEPPESVPINRYVKVQGTPLAPSEDFDDWDMVRMIAVVRIFLPKTTVRLSAGRLEMHEHMQGMCMLAGANSIFIGDKLLTTQNPQLDRDLALLTKLGLKPQGAGESASPGAATL